MTYDELPLRIQGELAVPRHYATNTRKRLFADNVADSAALSSGPLPHLVEELVIRHAQNRYCGNGGFTES